MVPTRFFANQITINATQTDWLLLFVGDFVFPMIIALALLLYSKKTIFGQLLKDKAASERYEMKRLVFKIGGNARVISLLLHQNRNTIDHVKSTNDGTKTVKEVMKNAGIFDVDERISVLHQEMLETSILLKFEILHCFGADSAASSLYDKHQLNIDKFFETLMQPVTSGSMDTSKWKRWLGDVDAVTASFYETEKTLLDIILHKES